MKHSVLIFTTTYFPLVGGAEVAVKEITDRLPEQEFDLVCAKIKKDLPRLENIGHVRVHRFGFGYAFDKYLFAAFGGCYGLWLTRRLKQPVIWAVMASYGGFAALVSRLFRRDARFLLTLQEGDPLEHYTKRAGMFSSLHKLIFKHADAVQAISRFLADWAKQMGFCGTPSVIPNGVDLEVFDVPQTAEERKRIRTEHGFAENDIVLVTASRLVTKNGVDLLIRSLVHLPISYKALILGVGEDADALHAIVTELGLETRVVFAGSRPHRELVSFYQASDIFVRASRSEGLGNAFLEAMATGLPIIGTRVGGIPDFLLDGETGVFCETENPVSLAQAVQHIWDDAALRAKLIEQGRALVRQKYNWNTIAGLFHDVLKQLVSNT